MRYHNLNVSPYALPYVFVQVSMLCGYLQRVKTRYWQIYEKVYIIILKK